LEAWWSKNARMSWRCRCRVRPSWASSFNPFVQRWRAEHGFDSFDARRDTTLALRLRQFDQMVNVCSLGHLSNDQNLWMVLGEVT
jgi:hypothetical protein